MKEWPKYYKDLLVIGCNKSNIGLTTLWTPVKEITANIDKNLFNVAGQLYSHRGVNYIIRNVFLNPVINTLVLCGRNMSGSAETLIAFFENGVDKNHIVIGTNNIQVDDTIPIQALELFRQNVKLINMANETDLKVIVSTLKKYNTNIKALWTKPTDFPEVEVKTSNKFPSEKIGYKIDSSYISEAWIQALRVISKFGSRSLGAGMIKVGGLSEIINLIITINDEDPFNPRLIKQFPFDEDDLAKYYKNFFSTERDKGSYSYGERIFAHPLSDPDGNIIEGKTLNQIKRIISKFNRDERDRGLIAALWNPWIDNQEKGWMSDKSTRSGNTPCLSFLQFTHRSKKLNLTAYFRSNDIFNGWPLNAFALRKLQYEVAYATGKSVGKLITISNCAHIYERDYTKLSQIIKDYSGKTFCLQDERGSCVISTEKDHIVIKHLSPDGSTILQEFTIDGTQPKAAQQAFDMLNENLLFQRIEHAADISAELTKAEYCLKNNIPYIQDQSWESLTGLKKHQKK